MTADYEDYRSVISAIGKLARMILYVYLAALCIRFFVLEAYQIPSQSMAPSLLTGDTLMVEKLSYGNRLSIFGWKIPGFYHPKHNEFAVFVSPAWKSPGFPKEVLSVLTLSVINLDNTYEMPKNLVKRVVAVPGDLVSMANKVLSINGSAADMKFVRTAVEIEYSRMVRSGFTDYDLFEEKYLDGRRIIQHYYGDRGLNAEEIYHFPPILVPAKGDIIALTNLTSFSAKIYRMLVARETGKKAEWLNGRIFLDGKEILAYRVHENYFWLMGDNRDVSEDSRSFGLVPESLIFGRPLFRYFPFSRASCQLNAK